jgi:hypothetical protein
MRLRALCLFCLSLGFLSATGCISTNVRVDQARRHLRAGDDAFALAWSEDLKQSFYSRRLGCLETGRIRMLSGDFQGSSTNFASVIDAVIEKTESGPVLRLGNAGAQVMAGTITDDRMRDYSVPAYEFIQALGYQMLNHLFLGNLEAAGVEARRAVFAQDAIAEKYGREVRDAQAQAARSRQAAAVSSVNARMQSLAPVIARSRSSFENGLVWYLCGVLFEQQNDAGNAALSYRKAWELAPGNPYVQKDFLRLIRTQDAELFKSLVSQTGIDVKSLARDRTEVIVIVEESLVSQRLSIKSTLPVGGTLVSMDFPFYHDPAYAPMVIEVRDRGQTCGLGAPALSVQSLAYRDLQEKMPGVVLRNVTRAATHIAAQQAANRRNDNVRVGVLAANIFSAVLNQADMRAWSTLPMGMQLYRGGIAPGEHLLELRNQATGLGMRIPVQVAPDETRIIWVADIGGRARVATASLNGKGGATTFQICDSMLPGDPADAAMDHRKGGRR